MPARCSSRASIRPAGPAPMIPTCVRISLAPDELLVSYKGSLKPRQRDELMRRPAVTRHSCHILTVWLAEFGFEIGFLALDHAVMNRQGARRQHHQGPIRCQCDADTGNCEGHTNIHWIAYMGENARCHQRARRLV